MPVVAKLEIHFFNMSNLATICNIGILVHLCWPLSVFGMPCVLLFCPHLIISPTFLSLWHGFLNSHTALSLTYWLLFASAPTCSETIISGEMLSAPSWPNVTLLWYIPDLVIVLPLCYEEKPQNSPWKNSENNKKPQTYKMSKSNLKEMYATNQY